ncbi:hypothetical protein [Mesorhizobium sp. M0085]|uniref:hypothetical protein n=1 Tax=Mesorhizobium sp. M0085 TaxID=2956872 RepID=UPI0033397BB6
MKIVTDFPRKVREIENVFIPLSDGTRLAARVWLPEDAESVAKAANRMGAMNRGRILRVARAVRQVSCTLRGRYSVALVTASPRSVSRPQAENLRPLLYKMPSGLRERSAGPKISELAAMPTACDFPARRGTS